MKNFLLLAVGVCSPSLLMAAVFSWTDQSGNIVFGDKPPEGVTTKQVTLPKITVLDNFSSRYGATEDTTDRPKKDEAAVSTYENLSIIAPKQGQAIRANDGEVSAALSFTPKLQVGDEIVFTVDGKVVQQGVSKIANMTSLNRGEHVLSVSIVNQSSETLISSESVTFSVLKASAL